MIEFITLWIFLGGAATIGWIVDSNRKIAEQELKIKELETKR
jgi:hypothetical protein